MKPDDLVARWQDNSISDTADDATFDDATLIRNIIEEIDTISEHLGTISGILEYLSGNDGKSPDTH